MAFYLLSLCCCVAADVGEGVWFKQPDWWADVVFENTDVLALPLLSPIRLHCIKGEIMGMY